MAEDSVYVLGAANLKRRTRTNKAGKSRDRYTVEIKGDSILINTDPKTLGQGPAEAIAEVLRDKVRGITATVSSGTRKYREAALKAFNEGKPHAMRRYAGGRTGAKQPNQSDRLFNDSGRFAESIAVGARDEAWTVNVAANRLSPDTLTGGAGALTRIYQRLLELVPEFGDARQLLNSSKVVKALEAGIHDAIQRVDERNVELRKQRMSAAINLARNFISLLG
jgi:hypothetical protein